MPYDRIVFSEHVQERLFRRRLTARMVREALQEGETIETYPDTGRGESYLVLGWSNEWPIHVVAADKDAAELTVVVTAYRPLPELWSDDYRRRK